MAKKQHHTYNVGDIVTFKFLTGDILTGKIVNHTYKENGTPDYKIRVEDSRGFTIYPCMTDERIIKRNKTALAVMKAAENKQKNNAIDAQKKFLGND